MAKNCNKCNHSNPEDAKFCNSCGEEFTPENSQGEKRYVAINEKDLNAQAYVEEFRKNMQAYAEMTRHQELDKFQSQATSWAKFQFAGIIAAITALAAFLGFVGFKGIDLQETIDGAKEQLEVAVKDAQHTINTGTSEIVDKKEESQKSVQELMKRVESETAKLDEINAQTQQSKLALDKHIARIKNMEAKLTEQINKVSKMERSRYKIQVHYDVAQLEKSNRKSISDLQAALLDKGYVIGSDNIMSVSTDEQEVIYYSNSQEVIKNAREIRSALANRFGNINLKLEKSDRKDPYEIVVKLCRKLNSDRVTCDNN